VTNQVDREEVEWVENRARELCTGNERNKVETITAVRNVMINAYRATAAAIWSQWPERSRGRGLSAVWVMYGNRPPPITQPLCAVKRSAPRGLGSGCLDEGGVGEVLDGVQLADCVLRV